MIFIWILKQKQVLFPHKSNVGYLLSLTDEVLIVV